MHKLIKIWIKKPLNLNLTRRFMMIFDNIKDLKFWHACILVFVFPLVKWPSMWVTQVNRRFRSRRFFDPVLEYNFALFCLPNITWTLRAVNFSNAPSIWLLGIVWNSLNCWPGWTGSVWFKVSRTKSKWESSPAYKKSNHHRRTIPEEWT